MGLAPKETPPGRRFGAIALSALLAFSGVPVAPAIAEEEAIVADGQAQNTSTESEESSIVASGQSNDDIIVENEDDNEIEALESSEGEGISNLSVQGDDLDTQNTVSITFQAATVDDNNKVSFSDSTESDCTVVTSNLTTWSMGTYVVNTNVTIDSQITVTSDARLILVDGCTLTATKGINVPINASLTIYGQSGNSGKLVAAGDTNCAGIGGSKTASNNAGKIVIHGGTIEATGNGGGAGIGGGAAGSSGGSVIIYGGTVTATGSNEGAGIGGGGGVDGYYGGDGGTIKIYGGTVTATSQTGGQGEGGAGIGGAGGGGTYSSGSGTYFGGGASGAIAIYGGTVTATGSVNGPGIGWGYGYSSDTSSGDSSIVIDGGAVAATAGNASAVGIDGNTTYGDDVCVQVSSDNESWTVFINEGKQYMKAHTHSLTGSSSGATITVGCSVEGFNTGESFDLAIVKPAHETYGDGNSTSATLTGTDDLDAFKRLTALSLTTDITYYAATLSDGVYTISDSALAAVPTNAGDYVAQVRLSGLPSSVGDDGSLTAQVGYTIAKADSSISLADETKTYTGSALTYGGTVTKSGSTGAVTYAYYADEDCQTTASEVVNAGTYYVKATLASDDNHNEATSEAAKLIVNKAAGSISYATTKVNTAYNDTSNNTLTNTGDGAVTYASSDTSIATVDNDGKVTATGIGTTTITATVEDGTNYTYGTTTASYELVVAKAEITPEVSIAGWIFGQTPSTPTVKASTNPGNGDVTYEYRTNADGSSYSTTVPTAAGGYVVRATVAETTYYKSGTDTAEFTIFQDNTASISYTETSMTKAYGDEAFTNTLTNTGDGTVTYASSDENVATVDASTGEVTIVAPGKATVTATAADSANYAYNDTNKTASYTLTVSKASISPKVTIEGWTYGGTKNAPQLAAGSNPGNGTVTYKYKVKNAEDSTYSDTVPTNAGAYTVQATVEETTNYQTGIATADFTIGKASLTVTANDMTIQYNTTPDFTDLGYTCKGLVNNDTSAALTGTPAYETNYKTGSNVGTYAITPSGLSADNYTIAFADGTLTVEAADINLQVTLEGWTYGQDANAPSVSGNSSNGEVTYEYKAADADDSTYSTAVPTNAGTYTVRATVAATDSYKGGTATAGFTIAKATGTAKFASSTVTKTYGDDTFTNRFTMTGDGTVSISSGSKSIATVDALGAVTIVGAGEATITAAITDGTNYTYSSPTVTYALKVNKRTIGVDWSTPTTFTYDGTSHSVTATATNLAPLSGDTVQFAYTDNAKVDAGSYTATVTIPNDSNYQLPTSGISCSWSISKATADVSYETTAVTKTYGSSSFVNELTMDGDGTVAYSSSNPGVASVDENGTVDVENAGTTIITATVTDGTNYTYSNSQASYTLTVNKAVINPRVTIDGWTYGGTASKPSVYGDTQDSRVTYEYKTKGADDTTYSTSVPTDVGNYTVRATVSETISFKGGTATADFTISKAALTVTADDATIAYGAEKPDFSVTYTGFVKNEGASVLDGTLSYACDYKKGDNVGTYDITPSGLAADNYEITFAKGTLTVEAAEITPEVTISGWTYGETASTPQVTGNPGNGEVTYEYKAKGANDSTYDTTVPTAAGDYVVRATVAAAGNYASGIASANFTISQAAGSVTYATSAVTKAYGDEAFANKLTNTGDGTVAYASNDTSVAKVDASTGEVTILAPGTATITATAADGANYAYASSDKAASYTLTVTKRTLTITWQDTTTFTYDGNEHSVTADAGNLANSETVTLSYEGNENTNVGSYTAKITSISGDASSNYALPTEGLECAWKITKAAGKVSFSTTSETKTYGDDAFTIAANNTGDGTVTYASSNEKVATVDDSTGEVTIVAPGEATITATATDGANYAYANGDKTASYDLTVNKRTLTITWSGETTLTYDGQEHSVTAKATNLVDGDSIAFTYEDNTSTDVFSGDATITGITGTSSSNYALPTDDSVTCHWTINPLYAGSVSYAKSTVSKAYDAPAFTNELTNAGDGTVTYESSDTSVATIDANTGKVTIKGVGTATITATVDVDSAKNFSYITTVATYTLIVNKASLDSKIILDGWTYGETANTPKLADGTNPGGGDVTYMYKLESAGENAYTTTVPTAAGDYNVRATIAQTTNYDTTTIESQFTIAKAPLTVTAPNIGEDGSFEYGEPAESLYLTSEETLSKVTYTGFVNDDDKSVLSGAVTLSCSYKDYDDAGTYAITPSGTLTASNYEIIYKDGTLTVSPVVLYITWMSETTNFTYDGKQHSVTAAALNLRSADHVVTFEYKNNVKTKAGNYTAQVTKITGADGVNYKIDESKLSEYKLAWSISKASGSVSYRTTHVDKTYGDTAFTNALAKTGDGAVTYKSSNKNVATVDAATGKVTIAGAGNATITATVANGTNYSYRTKTVSYTLTVAKAPNPMKVKRVSRRIKRSKVAKKKVTVAKAVKITNAKGTIQYKVVKWVTKKAKKYFKVNAKTGKITAKKGTPKGAYRFKVMIKASGDANYKARTKYVTFKVIVK